MLSYEPNDIVLRNTGLVYYVINKKIYKPTEDDYSVGMIGLVKGSKGFDPDRGFSEGAYLSQCILNEVRMARRKERNTWCKLQPVHLDGVAHHGDDGSKLTGFEMLKAPIDVEYSAIFNVYMDTIKQNMRDRLTPKEYIALWSLYEGRKQREVALEIGCEQSYVARLRQNASRKVRKGMQPCLPSYKSSSTIKMATDICA